MSEEHRIAIVKPDKCKPNKCSQECWRCCPVNRSGQQCIEVTRRSKIAKIAEILCIGCNLCVKKCPFEAIDIIKLPVALDSKTVHRFGQNSFKLHGLPEPRPGEVLGLVGRNGIGKSTALKILSGRLKPNFGRYEDSPDWEDILRRFRGSMLQAYFTRMLNENLVVTMKPQFVDQIPRAVRGPVGQILADRDNSGRRHVIMEELGLENLSERPVSKLSGGELQRFACCVTACRDAQVFMFDEPSSYLDVVQRLKVAEVIRSLLASETYVVCVEHDLSVLDYLSDFICVLYGIPAGYGVVTMPHSVREGINMFLAGYIPSENMRFRPYEIVFRIGDVAEEISALTDAEEGDHIRRIFNYPSMKKTLGAFTLEVQQGQFADSEIIVLVGENGTGKTTLIRMLAGALPPDPLEDGTEVVIPRMSISYKPQKIRAKFEGTVQQLLYSRIRPALTHSQFNVDVVKALEVNKLMDLDVQHLSGGEQQRVGICLALGKPAEVYLLDEPSAYLDAEQRISAAKAIRRFILNSKKTAFIVEHDFIMATYLADRVIVYEGEPAFDCVACAPENVVSGFNRFLRSIDVTFRRDPNNNRPRINKRGSVKDTEQKAAGKYFGSLE